MVNFVKKYIFKGAEKNNTAPHIFLLLIAFLIVSTIYYVLNFYIDYIVVRTVLSVGMIITYVILERSSLKIDTLAFLTPISLMFWMMWGVVHFDGDFLVFSYTLIGGMLSLTYMKKRGYVIYISTVAAVQCFMLFVLGMPLMGERFTTGQEYTGFFVMVGMHAVLYIFAKKYSNAVMAKAMFLSSMSHEIRTPLNAIIGMTTIGKTSEELEKAHYTLKRIESASTHLLGVVNDILDMSKIDTGRFELAPKKFSFKKMMEHVQDMISFSSGDKEQTFTTTIDPHIPRFMYGDDQRLAQAIINLLGNAVKFTPRHGSISLKAKLLKIEDKVCTLQILVQDTGIGISHEQQKSLFESFRKANVNLAKSYSGTGLGLAITKTIVEMMGGKIGIESEPGKGSVFSFTVQIQRGYFQEDDDVEIDEIPNLKGYHILIAEDIEINREIILTLLEPTGVRITCAENGEEVVKIYNENPEAYDLIFMDIQMPEKSGCEATVEIRSLPHPSAKDVPIIAMTANVLRDDVELYLKLGMDGHVGKPININEVFHLITNVLKK
ncbi:MAG: ATP-binding protein [Defluviitaleaceae bacterium]|nr:ATP-binding protein [Defluviitaleaceae bacterium]